MTRRPIRVAQRSNRSTIALPQLRRHNEKVANGVGGAARFTERAAPRGRVAVAQAALHTIERLEDRRLFSAALLGAAEQAQSSTPLGLNLGSQSPYANDALFFDVRKEMDNWASAPNAYLPSSELTSTGYPLASAYTFTEMLGYPLGTYTLVYSSTGTATVTPASMGAIVPNTTTTAPAVVNGVAGTTTTVQVLVQSDPADPRLVLNANNVDANDQISDLHFYMPGYVPGQAPPVLNPNVAAKLAPFGTLRLMDLLNASSTPIANWADRDLPADFSDVDDLGVAYEDVVAMANELQVNLWWNIPVAATPNYTTDGITSTTPPFMIELADLMKYGSDGVNAYTGPAGLSTPTNPHPVPAGGPVYPGLDSNLKVYIEFGNELWHTGYAADTYNIAAGMADPDIPGSSLTNANPAWFDAANNNGEFAYSAEQDVYELRQAYNSFSSVYGAGLSSQIGFVFAGDESTSVFTQAAFTYLSDMTGQWGTPASWISGFAVPTYVSLSAFDDPGLTLNQIFTNLDGQLTTGFASTISADVQLASSYNLPLFSYEGGQYLISNNENSAVKDEAQLDPRMGQFYTEMLNEWYSLGGSLILEFDFASPNTTGGDWGLLQSADDAGDPKWDAVIQRLVPVGDANLDGSVDWNDFLVLKANYGITGTYWQQGDFNGDGVVNAVDYAILAKNIDTSGFSAAQLSQFNNFLSTAAVAVQLPEAPNNIIGTSGSYMGEGNTTADVFDGDVNTFFDGPSGNGNTVGLNFGSQDTIKEIRFAPRPGFEQRMLGGFFEASNDPSFQTGDVILVPPITVAPPDGLTTEEIEVPGTYQYFQYVSPGGSYGNIAEIQVYGEPPSTTGTPSISATTTTVGQQNTTGLVITAADPKTVSYQISNITNGTLFQTDGVTPITNGAYITVAQAAAGLKFTPAAQLYTTASTPFSFCAEASSTGDYGGLGGGIATASITVNQSGSTLLAPTIIVSDPTGTYTGAPFIGTGTVTGTGGTTIATPTLNYYLPGDITFSNPLSTVPTAVGSYVAVASFTGNASYAGGSQSVGFSITRATPNVSVADTGGTYTGVAFAATATVTGVSGTPAASLEAVTPTLLYYSGSTATGASTATAPSAVGTYTVVANFGASTDYAAASSAPLNFTIVQATAKVSVTDAGGTYTGSAFPATATVTGVSGTPAASLEGVTPTLLYYSGSTATGASTATAPSAVGTYTVVANFGGSMDYAAANSAAANFTVAAVTTPMKLFPTSTTASTTQVWPSTPVEPYSNVFDGSTNSFWDSYYASSNWVQESFATPVNITSIVYAPRQGFEYRMEGGIFEASDDPNFGTFATLYTVPSSSQPAFALDTQSVSPGAAYQYVRYVAPSGSYGNIAEMQIFGTPAPTGPAPVVSTAPAATVGAAGTSAALSVAATETGNPALTYTWSVVTMPTGVTATPTFSATNGKTTGNAVTVSFPAGDIAGTYGLQVTITDPSGNSTVSPLSVVVGQVLTSIAITPSATTVSVPASGTQTFTASGLDQFGVTMATQPTVTWSLAANSTGTIGSSSGLYTASATVGATASVVATATGSNGTVTASQAIKTAVQSARVATPTLMTPTTTSASTTQVWPSTPVEPYSNVFDGSTNSFWDSYYASSNWVQESFATPVNITSIVYAPRQGFEYRMEGGIFEASDDPNFGTFATLYTVPSSSQPAFALDTQSVSPGAAYQYVRYVAPSGSYGNIAEMQIFGTPAPTGPAPVVSTAPAATVGAAGTSAALSVAATETGNPALTYTWSVVTMPTGVTATPTFSATNGKTTGNAVTVSFPAGDIAGTYGLQVTITDPSGNSTVSPLSVVVGQVLTSIAITPSATTVSVPASGTQTFTASGLDQFGVTMATQPTVTWSLAANSTGTIGSSSGLYTSSATVGATASVVATATGTNGTVTASQAVKTTAASTAPALLTPTSTTASTSVVYTPGPAEPYSNVFDGNTNTFWDSVNSSGNWVQENFGSAKTITLIAFAPRAGFEYRMEGGIFEASNDPNFGSFVTLYTLPTTSQPGDSLTTQTVSVTGTYQYVRYVAPANSYGNIAEMQVSGF